MSNSNIVARLNDLANGLENGHVSVATFAAQLIGHAEALEGMEYRWIKEAHSVRAQLMHAIEIGRENDVDFPVLTNWLRAWVLNVPVGAP